MTNICKRLAFLITPAVLVLMCAGGRVHAQPTETVNTFFYASYIVEIRCEGLNGLPTRSNCAQVKPDGSLIPVYRVPQDMYLIITSMDWRPFASGAEPDSVGANFGLVLVNFDGTVRMYWDVPRFDNAIHLYPT